MPTSYVSFDSFFIHGILWRNTKSVKPFADPWVVCSTIKNTSVKKREWNVFFRNKMSIINSKLFNFNQNMIYWNVFYLNLYIKLLHLTDIELQNFDFLFHQNSIFHSIATKNILRKCVYAEPGYESSAPDRKEDWSDVTLLQKSPEIPLLAFFYLNSLRIFRDTTNTRASSQYQSRFGLQKRGERGKISKLVFRSFWMSIFLDFCYIPRTYVLVFEPPVPFFAFQML